MRLLKRLSLKQKFLLTILLILFLAGWGIVGYFYGKEVIQLVEIMSPRGTFVKDFTPQVADFPNPINGSLYTQTEAAKWKNKVPLAVMVENHVLARPQSGLFKADIVYEALAEGNITRFMAIFLSQTTQAGPVRSAREYYYQWLSEYDAAYAHWGGNEYARALARRYFGSKDLDQFGIGSPTFYRLPPGSISEHSGYTHTDRLWRIATQRGVNKPVKIESWLFKEDAPSKSPKAKSITVGFTGDGDFVVNWRYDANTNSYRRFLGGAPHVDKEVKRQILVKTVIVCSMRDLGYKEVTPNVFNRSFQTTGQNTVRIFQDGSVKTGVWKKSSREGRTRFYDKSGKEISLNRGKIWIQMIPAGTSVQIR